MRTTLTRQQVLGALERYLDCDINFSLFLVEDGVLTGMVLDHRYEIDAAKIAPNPDYVPEIEYSEVPSK